MSFATLCCSYEILRGREISERFSQLVPAPDDIALYDPQAGLVDAALSNAAHIQLARGRGATVIDECPVTQIERDREGYIIVSG